MADPIKLYAGTMEHFDDSMAKAIEDALVQLLGPLPTAPEKVVHDRRALFIAISRGVINHLKSKQAALKIDFHIGSAHVVTNPNIDVKPSP
jgi:hypothetical protein